MKTAMQEHLEWLKARMTVTPQMEEELLTKEKQQIIDAYEEGKEMEYQYHINCDPVHYENVKTSEKYYNQTFKQD